MFSLVPAALIAYSMPAFTLIEFVKDTSIQSFGRLWLSGFRHPFSLIVFFAALLATTFVSACLSSALTYHMKIGKFGLPRFFSSINNNFFPCFSRTVVVGVAILFVYTVFVLFDALWNTILNALAAVIASAFTLAVLIFLCVYVVSSISLWLPTMIFTGRSFAVALSTAFSQSKATHRRFLSFYMILTLIVMGFSIGAYFVRNFIVSWVMTTVSYMLVMVLTHVFWFIAFFEENKMTRADLAVSAYKRRI